MADSACVGRVALISYISSIYLKIISSGTMKTISEVGTVGPTFSEDVLLYGLCLINDIW